PTDAPGARLHSVAGRQQQTHRHRRLQTAAAWHRLTRARARLARWRLERHAGRFLRLLGGQAAYHQSIPHPAGLDALSLDGLGLRLTLLERLGGRGATGTTP